LRQRARRCSLAAGSAGGVIIVEVKVFPAGVVAIAAMRKVQQDFMLQHGLNRSPLFSVVGGVVRKDAMHRLSGKLSFVRELVNDCPTIR